jgi:hypothetical protein
MWMPAPQIEMRPDAYSASFVIDATGEKLSFIGAVRTPNRGAKNITRIHWRWGTITKAGGSGLTVSLQDVDLANGPAFRPDTTQDQTVAVANADAGFASNTWYRSAALSAVRAVTHGELLTVVFEYDGAGRLGADSVVLAGFTRAGESWLQDGSSVFLTGSWATAGIPNILLEFDDGSFGTLDGSYPSAALGSLTFKQDTAVADEHGLEFTPAFSCKVDGFYAYITPGSADFDVVLYDGTTAMTNGTVSVDANSVGASTRGMLRRTFPGEVTLVGGHTYRLAIKPTQTAQNVVLFYNDLNHADHRQAILGGSTQALASRIDLGAWAAGVTTRIPFMGLRISALNGGSVT